MTVEVTAPSARLLASMDSPSTICEPCAETGTEYAPVAVRPNRSVRTTVRTPGSVTPPDGNPTTAGTAATFARLMYPKLAEAVPNASEDGATGDVVKTEVDVQVGSPAERACRRHAEPDLVTTHWDHIATPAERVPVRPAWQDRYSL